MTQEIGESAMYSFLKHGKQCLIVETNWKTASEWKINNYEKLSTLFNEAKRAFPDFFGKQDLPQVLRQAEIDAIGYTTQQFYMVDIAFHEFGLGYKNNNQSVGKKLLRSVFCMMAYFDQTNGEIFFASPKINPTPLVGVQKIIAQVQNFLDQHNIHIQLKLLANQSFTNEVIIPLQEACKNNADSNELFLRALQLLKCSNKL